MTIPSLLRAQVIQRADNRCEYCRLPASASFAPHEIDHIIAQKHGGLTVFENLALACILCNKHKGSDLTSIDPETQTITPLYHPRTDIWFEHFEVKEGRIVPLTATGRVTVFLLQLNRFDRIEERNLLLDAEIY